MMAKTIEIPEREYLAIIDARDRFAAEVVDLRRQMEAERTNAWVKANLYLDANADLRRQLAAAQVDRQNFEWAMRTAQAERDDLRRQLAECQAELLHYKTNGVSSIAQGRQVQP
jgi:hypothetical protein